LLRAARGPRKGQKSSNASQAQRSSSITDVSILGYQ
jgi:hypothetical protein